MKRLPGPRDLGRWVGRGARRALPVLAVVAVTALGFGGGTWARIWLATSPRFAVTELSISGNDRLSASEVHRAMGLVGGENIFSLDLDRLGRTLRRHPWVLDARIERRLPDRLLIDVTEQKPAAVAELGGLYLLDEHGVPFKRAAIDRGEGLDLLVITGITRAEYAMAPDAAHERFVDAMALAAVYRTDAARPEVGEVHIDDRRGTTLYSRQSAIAIRLGTGSRDQRLARLPAFDAAWAALSDEEKSRAVVIHANRDTFPQRVSVAFSQTR